MQVPCGRIAKKPKSDEYALLYNEYVVYNPAQVKLRFLVEISFEAPSQE